MSILSFRSNKTSQTKGASQYIPSSTREILSKSGKNTTEDNRVVSLIKNVSDVIFVIYANVIININVL